MHIKSFVLASFAASIATAIPVPQFCPYNYKRSAQQNGCVTQDPSLLPSVLPYLADPKSAPSVLSPDYYPSDYGSPYPAKSPNNVVTPPNNPAPDARPPPDPLPNWVAPAAGGAALGLGGWWKLRGVSPTGETEGGN